MQLPFLIVHGAIVGRVATIVLAAALVALVHLLRARAARRVGRARVAAVLARETEVGDGDSTVRGRLERGFLATIEGEQPREHATGEPTLLCDDGTRIALGGIAVLVGSSERTSRPWQRAWHQRLLAPGDSIVVMGIAERTAGMATDYRRDASAWGMRGAAMAVVPNAVAAPMPVALHATVISLALAASHGVALVVWL